MFPARDAEIAARPLDGPNHGGGERNLTPSVHSWQLRIDGKNSLIDCCRANHQRAGVAMLEYARYALLVFA